MTPALVLIILFLYFAMLVAVAWFTGRNVGNAGFFLANRKVPWYVVAYAMIGTSISGVTFISIPGKVGGSGLNMAFSYMQMVLGYLAGYLVIATVLMPMYYRMQLTSIYGYLEERLGYAAYKTGAGFFILSRTLGSATRMYLAATVLQVFVFAPLGIPFLFTVLLMLGLIYGYTFQGGLKTIIWTDTIMTTFFLAALVFTVTSIGSALNLRPLEIIPAVMSSRYGKVFFFDHFLSDPNHFIKQFVGGALIAITMTGLDQDLMQKNLACKNIREAQKNMLVFCLYLVVINFLFLALGALLYLYANSLGLEIPARTDYLYPKIAFNHLGVGAGIFFILGLIASTYASSDSALTALTTSFCVDFLNFEKQQPEIDPYAADATAQKAAFYRRQRRVRTRVHLGFSLAFVGIILVLDALSNDAVINLVFRIAGYTYGPLLGLFLFGLTTRLQLYQKTWQLPWNFRGRTLAISPVLVVCLMAPLLSWSLETWIKPWFDIGFLTILFNGLLTYFGLWIFSYRKQELA
ncbi:MAG: sodium:solute symporter [Bacteroidetes bacterium]|nr:sodium:solute symporter [Bacteroidota bacterium]